jgi:hypothetical protein
MMRISYTNLCFEWEEHYNFENGKGATKLIKASGTFTKMARPELPPKQSNKTAKGQ